MCESHSEFCMLKPVATYIDGNENLVVNVNCPTMEFYSYICCICGITERI